jgi:hypothetical protein
MTILLWPQEFQRETLDPSDRIVIPTQSLSATRNVIPDTKSSSHADSKALRFVTQRLSGFENPLKRTEEAAEKVAVTNRKWSSAAKSWSCFQSLRTA